VIRWIPTGGTGEEKIFTVVYYNAGPKCVRGHQLISMEYIQFYQVQDQFLGQFLRNKYIFN
jgi:hypothetical protein